MSLSSQITELESNLEYHSLQKESISTAPIGWQIEHSLLVIKGILFKMKESKPEDFVSKFSFKRMMVLSLQKIPKGKAKAPSVVDPKEYSLDNIQTLLKEVRIQIENISELNENQFFSHHVFGDMKRDSTIKFLQIHTQHHLKIIQNIKK